MLMAMARADAEAGGDGDADAAKFLDFDAPLSAQPKSVRDALKAYGNYPDNMKGSQIYEAIASSLAKPPFDNTIPSTKNPSSAKAAADALPPGDPDYVRAKDILRAAGA